MAPQGDGSARVDARGCLTAAGIAVLSAAPPGGGPPDLAAHIVACARCQDRLLAEAAGPRAARRGRPPSLGRTLAIAGGLLLAVLLLLMTLRALSGR